MIVMKTCTKCRIEQPISNFSKDKRGQNGLASQCKGCLKEYQRRYYAKNREKYLKAHREYYCANKERFKKLHAEWYEKNKEYAHVQHREYYQKNKKRIGERQRCYRNNHYNELITKERARRKTPERQQYLQEYYKKNKHTISKKNVEYKKAHPCKVAEWHKNYRKKHLNQIKEYAKEYRKQNKDKINQARLDRLHNDPVFKLKEQARNMLRCAFRTKGHKKESRSADILGCPLDFFCDYLKDTWEKRYGAKWNGQPCHIDHIVPLATAKTKEDIARLCHYTNLQLLTPEDNMKKSDKLL